MTKITIQENKHLNYILDNLEELIINYEKPNPNAKAKLEAIKHESDVLFNSLSMKYGFNLKTHTINPLTGNIIKMNKGPDLNNTEQSTLTHKYSMFVRLVMNKILIRMFGYENENEGGS